MNCAECQRHSLELGSDELPAAMSAHLLECPACRKAHQRAVSLRQLLSLKRFEQPDPSFEVRNLARVQAAIRDLDPSPRGWWAGVLDVLTGQPVPALRYAAAGLVLGLLGINWLSVRSLPPLPTASIEAVRTAQPVSLLAGPSATALPPGRESVAPAIFVTSNQHPWMLEQGSRGAQYGTGSRLAGFDF
jgi:hypothetical protein